MTRRLNPALLFAAPLLALTSLGVPTASAGWDNVFQVTCHNCRKERVSYAAPAEPCPPQREVRYEQRCYYEPVTVMKPERYTEEVPVRVRSYYWDPVTTYTRSSYYDPCSGQCQEVCVPKTCYVRKEQCNTVMKYVERMRMVPTQVNRKVCETRPVVTYYGPITRKYENCDPCDLPPTGGTPRVDELRQNAPSVLPESSSTIPPQQLPTMPQSRPGSSGFRPVNPTPTRNYSGTVNAHTTSRTPSTTVRGEVLASDKATPQPGAKVVFMNAKNPATREYATADAFGHFDTKLPAGEWYVYLGSGNGKAAYHSKVTLGEQESRTFKVVSR